MRDGLDIADGLSSAALGGIAQLGEALFDGFFGGAPVKPQREQPAAVQRGGRPKFPPDDPFKRFAEDAAKRAATVREEYDRAWWDERERSRE